MQFRLWGFEISNHQSCRCSKYNTLRLLIGIYKFGNHAVNGARWKRTRYKFGNEKKMVNYLGCSVLEALKFTHRLGRVSA